MSHIRSELLDRAIARLAQLPAEDQDRFAIEILADLCTEQEWILIVSSEPYQKWLDAKSGQVNGANGRPAA